MAGVPIFDLIVCLSQAVDLVSPLVADHHKRVAYISWRLSEELGLPLEQQKPLVVAAALHDIGGLSRQDRIDALRFEYEDPYGHAEAGYLLLKTFSPFEDVARLIRFHHILWKQGAGVEYKGKAVPAASHLIHLADRIAVLIDPNKDVLSQAESISKRIGDQKNEMFLPEFVDAFQNLADKEYFWCDTVSPHTPSDIHKHILWDEIELGDTGFFDLTHLFSRIIDFRSPFTAAHSAGVAACAEALARLAGFKEEDCRMIHISGYLHDLGKLAVPSEILDKINPLSRKEFDAIRCHAYYTHRILETVSTLDLIRCWGSQHHERLDGSGYLFHLKGKDLSTGSRIVAVADVFVALTEDRPYRKGTNGREALDTIQKLAVDSALDFEIIGLLEKNFNEINAVRNAVQVDAIEEYNNFIKKLGAISKISEHPGIAPPV